ncbi:MAG: dienelactone hydrolase family protein [Armatimonadetes bacterium]|nr:dienelactone hydrolase family protein [Armatimonadota bacterium]
MNEARRARLWSLLGDLPDSRPISAELTDSRPADGYRVDSLRLDLNGIEPVPAYLLVPDNLTAPAPGIVFNHSHGGHYHYGREELFLETDYFLSPYGPLLAQLGYVVIAIDNWCFGERSHTGELDTFKKMLWHGQWLWGMMMWDSHRAVDYLASRPEVDPARLGTVGLSMGCTAAWWLAALDVRIKAACGLVCLTEYQALMAHHMLQAHGIYYFIPSLLKHFQTEDIIRLICPRAFLSCNGDQDAGTPPEGVERVKQIVARDYAQAGVPDALRILRYPVGHWETAEMRAEVVAWLARHLGGATA